MALSEAFERHLQSGIALLLMGVIVWVGSTLLEISNSNARFEERLTHLTQQIADLKSTVAARMQDRFTGREGALHEKRLTQHELMMSRMQEVLDDHEERIDRLESLRNP